MSSRRTGSPRRLLDIHGLRPRRALGQNFLADPVALQQVIDAAQISSLDTVLEIGAGVGNLTRLLARSARRVVAVEMDRELAAICRQELRTTPTVAIVEGDILSLAPAELGLPAGYVIVANIPYYITSAILRHILEAKTRPSRVVLTIQKEVAVRICSLPPHMSLLAVSVQVHGIPRMMGDIPARAFDPQPRVDSAIVRVDCFEQSLAESPGSEWFFRTVRAGFLQPRKMLRNSMAAGFGVPTGALEPALISAGIDPQQRAETLSVEEWITLAAALQERLRPRVVPPVPGGATSDGANEPAKRETPPLPE